MRRFDALVTQSLVQTTFRQGIQAGLPFIPFDVFDFLTRILPGPLITIGFDTMVGLIPGLHTRSQMF